MNYFKILCALDEFFARQGVRYAVVGAFALNAYGLTRATADLDLVTESRGQSRTLEFLGGLGYEALYVSPGYSNHVHPMGALGRVELVYMGGPPRKNSSARPGSSSSCRVGPFPCRAPSTWRP